MISDRLATHRRLVVGGALTLWATGTLAFFGLVLAYDLDFFGPLGGPFVLGFGAFTITGAVIAWHRPGHVVGIVFLVLGLVAPLSNTVGALAMGPFAGHARDLRTLFLALGFAATTAVFPLLPLSIVLFPDGRLPSPRWRWTLWVAAATSALGGVAAFSGGAWGGDPSQTVLGPPLGGSLRPLADVLSPVFFAAIPLLLLCSVVAAVHRFRRGDPVTRQQLKWLALAAATLGALTAVLFVTVGAVATPPGVPAVVFSIGVALIPASAGIAIVRHRLYDVDLVLNRAIVFGTLAAFITALYVATVVGVGSVVGATNLVLEVGAIALVAVAFEPVRARVQHWANRAVYGQRATPYEVLTTMVDELATSASSEDRLAALAALLADGTGADHATIWVELGGTLRAAACAPAHDLGEHRVVALPVDGRIDLPAVTHAQEVWLDGELLGALSFQRGRDDPVTPHERALLTQMAGQAALVLGNARLRERLRARADELRASRQRLVTAQDGARRKLERDLHDGAQQQLVALKVKLGLARTIAVKEAAPEQVTGLIDDLAAAADVAVGSLRTLARGVYPPLLEAEGLERALTTQLQRSPIPVELRAGGMRRYGRQVEATVYFCVLEAVRDAVSHATVTRLEVLLEDRDGQVHLRVADDRRGSEPSGELRGVGLANVEDRIDALGGHLVVEARAGCGVAVAASIPVDVPVLTGDAGEFATV